MFDHIWCLLYVFTRKNMVWYKAILDQYTKKACELFWSNIWTKNKESMWVVFNLLFNVLVTLIELLCHSQEFFSATPNQQRLCIQLLAMLRVTISWFRFSVVSRIGECEIFYKLLTRWYPSVHLCRDTPATIPILRQCKLIYLPVPCRWVLCWATWLCVLRKKCYTVIYIRFFARTFYHFFKPFLANLKCQVIYLRSNVIKHQIPRSTNISSTTAIICYEKHITLSNIVSCKIQWS